MSGFVIKNPTFTVGTTDVVEDKLGKFESGGVAVVHNTATETDEPLFIFNCDALSGDSVSVTSLVNLGTVMLISAGVITAGDKVTAAAAGEIQTLPVGAGTYRNIGIALKDAVANEAIPVFIYDFQSTTTVT